MPSDVTAYHSGNGSRFLTPVDFQIKQLLFQVQSFQSTVVSVILFKKTISKYKLLLNIE